MPYGIAISNRATPPKIHHCVQRMDRRMGITVYKIEFGTAPYGIDFFSMSRGSIHGHDIELRTVAQGIVDDVIARSTPQHDTVPRNINPDFCHRHGCTERRVTRWSRLTIAHKFAAEQRAN